jgi:hypothetical protein
MDEASGDGWAGLQSDGSIIGQIYFHRGDEADFTARPWKKTSSDRVIGLATPGVSARIGLLIRQRETDHEVLCWIGHFAE